MMARCEGEDETTLVLVDDDAPLREALRFSLEIDGFAVQAYATGEAAAAAPDLPERGCLVLDFRLPGMDGLTLLDTLRRRAVHLPAVLMTSNPGAGLLRRAHEAGVRVVEKPLLFDELVQSIREALRAPARSA